MEGKVQYTKLEDYKDGLDSVKAAWGQEKTKQLKFLRNQVAVHDTITIKRLWDYYGTTKLSTQLITGEVIFKSSDIITIRLEHYCESIMFKDFFNNFAALAGIVKGEMING